MAKAPTKEKPVEVPAVEETRSSGTDQPPIIQYTNLLHAWDDENAPKVQEFLKAHSHDDVFMRRARVVNQLFMVKKAAKV